MDKHKKENQIKARARAYQLFESLYQAEPEKAFIQIWTFNGEIYYGFDEEIGYQLLLADPDLLIEKARISAESFEMLSKGLAHALINDLTIPKSAKIFIAEYLINPKARPPMKVGKRSDKDFNMTLRLALINLNEAGIPPSRNDATDPDHNETGIDIILEILNELGELGDRDHENLQRLYFRIIKRYKQNQKLNSL